MGSAYRLSPKMGSRKMQALRAIKEYFREWGRSPSLGEIGGALGIHRQHADKLLDALARDGLIIRRKGARGISLPDPAEMLSREDLLQQLRLQGFTVDADIVRPPPGPDTLTYSGLPMLPELDDIPPAGDIPRPGTGESRDDNTKG